jgi:hypothetical protein
VAVVGDLHDDSVPATPDLHPCLGGAGVLGDVGQCLADDEVGRGLHRGGRARVDLHRDVDPDRGLRGLRGQGCVEAAAGEDRGVDATSEVAQFRDGQFRVGVCLVDEVANGVRVPVEFGLGSAEAHRDRNEPLLRAVVQVPLDAPALGLGRVHATGAGSLQVLGLVLEPVGPIGPEEGQCQPAVGPADPGHHPDPHRQQDDSDQPDGELQDAQWKADHQVGEVASGGGVDEVDAPALQQVSVGGEAIGVRDGYVEHGPYPAPLHVP